MSGSALVQHPPPPTLLSSSLASLHQAEWVSKVRQALTVCFLTKLLLLFFFFNVVTRESYHSPAYNLTNTVQVLWAAHHGACWQAAADGKLNGYREMGSQPGSPLGY